MIKENFINIYKSLATEFINKIKNLKGMEGIPEPFLPVYGKNFEKVKCKIAFVGKETKSYGSITNFIEDFIKHPENALFREEGEFDEFEFTNWTNNFKTSFWDFVLQFLAKFYKLQDWEILKEQQHTDILSSFAWCNTNAIERYEVSAQGKNVDYETWLKVKNASIVFDNAEYLIKSLKPNVLIILNWEENLEWLTKNVVENIKPIEIGDHLQYYYLKNYDIHVYWTAHPRWLSANVGFDYIIDKIINDITKKLEIESLNNFDFSINNENSEISEDYNSIDYKREYIYKLAKFLTENKKYMSAIELAQHFNRNNILTSYGTTYEGGRGTYKLIGSTYKYFESIKEYDKAEYIASAFVNEDNDFVYEK